MTKKFTPQECNEFQSHLPELVGTGADLSNDPHIENCELCRALLADLKTIAEAARELFPAVEPPDEVWQHIESAIKKKNGPELMGTSASPRN